MCSVPNFEIEIPLLKTLIEQSKEEFCFVETHTNETIPIKDCTVEQSETETYVRGFDYINNRFHTFSAFNIKVITNTASDNTFFKLQKENFIKIAEMCEAENISINPDLLYVDLPVYQKVISMSFNKKYEEITLEELKGLWKFHIEKNCTCFENYILLELDVDVNPLYKSELLSIQAELSSLKQHAELNVIKTKERLTSYWPTILMPSPCFVTTSF